MDKKKKSKNQPLADNKLFHVIPHKYRSVVLTLILDVAFCVFAYFVARITFYYQIDMELNYKNFEAAIISVIVIVTIAMFIFFDCYNSVWKYAGRVEFIKLLLAYFATFGTLMIFKLVMDFVFTCNIVSPIILLYLLFSAILSIGMRFLNALINYFKHLRNMVDQKSVAKTKKTIVIGAGYTGSLAINRFINNPHEGYFPVALIDDDLEKQGRNIYGIRVEGGMKDIESIVKRFKAEMIVIAIMSITKSELKSIYSICSKFNLPIKIMPAIANADAVSNNAVTLRDIKIEELLGRDEFQVQQNLIDEVVKDKVVLVTGGAGSIGSELCRQALKFGCKHLIIFDMHENGMFDLDAELSLSYNKSKYTLVMGTVREKSKVKDVFDCYSPNIVFHAAAYKHVPMMEISSTEAIKNNVFGTLNVINQCVESKADKFVFISTDKAVNPANVMGASKRIAEMLVESIGEKSNLKMAAVRFGNVLGSNGSVIPTFLRQIREGGPITLTDKNIKRYFMTIPEAVRLVLQTGALAASGEVFVLDMGEPVYIYDLACDLIRINGLIPETDIPIVITGLRPGEKLFEELRYDKEMVDNTVHEGIFVTKLEKANSAIFEKQLEKLYKYAVNEDNEKTTETIFKIVPSAFRNMAAQEQIDSMQFKDQGVRTDSLSYPVFPSENASIPLEALVDDESESILREISATDDKI